MSGPSACKHLLCRAAAALVFLCVAAAQGATSAAPSGGRSWYIDCAAGNDAADGLSPGAAWLTSAAVSAHSFHPGDVILFHRGSSCHGMLAPGGSGAAGAPIRMDAWGTGPLPHIHAAPGEEAALKLVDQEYWTVEHLEFSGGQPHGVYITGSRGVLHGIHISDVIVHDVTGEPKDKEGGLLVIATGGERQRFDDVVVDGVTAYRASQWAGILVGSTAHGFVPEEARSTHVVVRNSIVHDVAGDGIVLFQVNNGLIENSVAWHTGMQETQTIGTPNAIWTWMCRDCTLRRNEAFLTDSPGVDGGAFDIDYGNANSIVEENYGHDTQGYCVAVFGAGWVTTNSIVRDNICSGNGRSPRLAERQGAVFLATWNNGKISGLRFSGNRIFWNPPIAAAVVVNTAEFDGKGMFEEQTIRSSSPFFIRTNPSLAFDHNTYEYSGTGGTLWEMSGKVYRGYEEYRRDTGQDAHSPLTSTGAATAVRRAALLTVIGATREQIAELISVHRQFPGLPLHIVTNAPPDARDNLRFNWNIGDIPVTFDASTSPPAFILTDSAGKAPWRHDGSTPPGDLGLALRSLLGDPDYAQLNSE